MDAIDTVTSKLEKEALDRSADFRLEGMAEALTQNRSCVLPEPLMPTRRRPYTVSRGFGLFTQLEAKVQVS